MEASSLASLSSELEHTSYIFMRTVLLVYFKYQHIHAETYGTELGATDLNAELGAKICGVEWWHLASTSTATLDWVAKLGTMTYGADMCYLGADPMGSKIAICFSKILNVKIFYKKD